MKHRRLKNTLVTSGQRRSLTKNAERDLKAQTKKQTKIQKLSLVVNHRYFSSESTLGFKDERLFRR